MDEQRDTTSEALKKAMHWDKFKEKLSWKRDKSREVEEQTFGALKELYDLKEKFERKKRSCVKRSKKSAYDEVIRVCENAIKALNAERFDPKIHYLASFDTLIIHMAIMYAMNTAKYGVDITQINTATEHAYALQKAELRGYAEAMRNYCGKESYEESTEV